MNLNSGNSYLFGRRYLSRLPLPYEYSRYLGGGPFGYQFPAQPVATVPVSVVGSGSFVSGGGGVYVNPGSSQFQIPVQVPAVPVAGSLGVNFGQSQFLTVPHQGNGRVLVPTLPGARGVFEFAMDLASAGICRIHSRRPWYPRFIQFENRWDTTRPTKPPRKRRCTDSDNSDRSARIRNPIRPWVPTFPPLPFYRKLFKSPKRLQTNYGRQRHQWRLDQKRNFGEHERKRNWRRRLLELRGFKTPLKEECEWPSCQRKRFKRNRPFMTLSRSRKTPSRLSLLSVRSRSPITLPSPVVVKQ